MFVIERTMKSLSDAASNPALILPGEDDAGFRIDHTQLSLTASSGAATVLKTAQTVEGAHYATFVF